MHQSSSAVADALAISNAFRAARVSTNARSQGVLPSDKRNIAALRCRIFIFENRLSQSL